MARLGGCSPLLLPLLLNLALLSSTPAWGLLPTLPRPITGRPSCVLPIKVLYCTRDERSDFVAGVGTSYGEKFGVKSVCSDGGASTFLGRPSYQETWDMSAPTAAEFPKLPNGDPDLRYFYPYGAPITQMIVLSAPNPFGDKFGTIPAIIFVYLTDQGEGLGTAVCGNADYAMSYLDPANNLAAPTVVTLKAQFTNPLSAELPARYLGSFEGKCGLLGRGFLGGDPHTSSKYALKHVYDACFAAPAPFIPGIIPGKQNETVTLSDYDPNTPYIPCLSSKHVKHSLKHGGSSSCIMNGYAVATGKYSLVTLDDDNMPVAWEPDQANGGHMKAARAKAVFQGTHAGSSRVGGQ